MKLAWVHDLIGSATGRLSTETRNTSVVTEDTLRAARLGSLEQQEAMKTNGVGFAERVYRKAVRASE